MSEVLVLNFAQSIINGSLEIKISFSKKKKDIKIKKIKLDMWHKTRQQLQINLDSNCDLSLILRIYYIAL